MGVHRKTRNLELVLDAFRNAEALSAQLLMERLPADVNRSDIPVARSPRRRWSGAFIPNYENVKFYALCRYPISPVLSHARFNALPAVSHCAWNSGCTDPESIPSG